MNILFISAHPDDNILIGGTIYKLHNAGYKVYEMVLTSGESGINKSNVEENLANIRSKEIEDFAKRIGITKVYTLKHKDGFVGQNNEEELRAIEIMRSIDPQVIITLHDQDYHHDHRNTFEFTKRIVENASRGFMSELGPKISDFILLTTDGLNALGDPHIYVNTTKEHAYKIESAKTSYTSQISQKLLQFTEGMALMRGGRVGYTYAEAFKIYTMPWYYFTGKKAKILAEFLEIAEK